MERDAAIGLRAARPVVVEVVVRIVFWGNQDDSNMVGIKQWRKSREANPIESRRMSASTRKSKR